MNPEALLRIADEFCTVRRTHIQSFPALVALSSLFGASISGVPLYRNDQERAVTIKNATTKLAPLAGHNTDFGEFLAELSRRLD
ncbi:MAG: TetR family transcriptional regulator [Corynebacterium sp.]|nr:TetR family transcriptional regulator [Corynebacterium sp.]